MARWFDIIISLSLIISGIASIWKRDIPFELEEGPELFRIRGVYAVLFGILAAGAGVYFLSKAI